MAKNYYHRLGRNLRVSCSGWLLGLMIASAFMLQGATAGAAAQQQGDQVHKLTVSLSNVEIAQVFEAIKVQTGLSVVYNVSDVDPKRRVGITANNEPLASVLDRLFAGTDITYSINQKHIVLSKRQVSQSAKGAITGIVLDMENVPLIGASVVIQGTSTGVAADLDGNFSINVTMGDVLEVSYAGYNKTVVPVTNFSPLRVVLSQEAIAINDVVVTALGLKRETKALTYNVQEIGSSTVNLVKDASFINSLSGKVAGVQLNSSASGIGGSTRVVMRGTKSMFGENNALYVVDGIPMPSLRTEQTESIYETPDGGEGDGISNLNPEDIESISVLTGAASAALYGGQGANGVIIITTKRGEEGKLRVNYSNNTSFMSPFLMPKFQNTYGSVSGTYYSWGQKMGSPTSYDPADFFQTGYNTTNSFSISRGTERSQTYLSAAAVNARGIIDNNTYNRYNFNVRQTTELIDDKLTLDLNFSYIRQNDQNMLTQGRFHNPLIATYLFPRGDDITKYQVYERYNESRDFKTQYWPYTDDLVRENPYWVINRHMFNVKKDRYMYSANLQYKMFDWLTASGRVRMDNDERTFTRKIYASSSELFASDTGNYLNHKSSNKNIYADAMLNIDHTFLCDFGISAVLGASIVDHTYNKTGYEGDLLYVPNSFTFSNIDTTAPESGPLEEGYREQTQAVFATAQLSYKNMVFLDLTARAEWASQLAFTPRMSLFYPSVGLSGVISDMVNMKSAGVSFLKLRASYSEVGNPPIRFITSKTYPYVGGMYTVQTYMPATGLKPERTKSFEAGINARFINGKINLDLTYYNSNTHNQLFHYEASAGAEYNSYYLNAGKVNNWGIEAALTYKDRRKDWGWSSGVTFTMNRNKILEMVPEGTIDPTSGNSIASDIFNVTLVGAYKVDLVKGGSMNDVYVSTLAKDHQGNIRVDFVTQSISADTDNWIKAGSTAPKFNLGWNNSVSYKNFTLGFLITARVGGICLSSTQALMDRYGVSQATANARDNGGVKVNGSLMDAQKYYEVTGSGTTGVLSEYIYDATNVRLKEVSLSYTLPNKWFNDKISNLTFSLTGSNLFMLYNKAPYDPELTASTSTYYQGYDYFMQPSLRNIGFSVRFQF